MIISGKKYALIAMQKLSQFYKKNHYAKSRKNTAHFIKWEL